MPAHRSIPFILWTSLALALTPPIVVPSLSQQREESSPTAAISTAAKARVAANYGHIPLSFEANRGQTDPSVQFLSRGRQYTLFLRPGEAVLALRSAKPHGTDPPLPADSPLRLPSLDDPHASANTPPVEVETSLVHMQLVGADPQAAVHEEDRQMTKTNYFIGNDPAKWRTHIPNYGRVRYAGIYPGIDLVFYGNQSRLEHDFVVAPGADPARIRLALDGVKNLRIDFTTGAVILDTSSGELRLLRPVAYQESNGHRTTVSSTYKLLADNRIGFALAAYDHGRPLVIDPVLVYSTYLGGSGDGMGQGDQGNGIAVDPSGNAYIVGTTYSTDYPVTSGAFESNNKSAIARAGGTVFVSKLNASGTALLYSTYLGGSGGDYGYGIALDSTDHPYITGATYSLDFPLTCGAIQNSNYAQQNSGAATVFVTKVQKNGEGIVYSTFLGGTGNHATTGLGDVAQAIAVDAADDAYIAGYTYSADFPSTKGALQTHFGGSATLPNAFVAKINPLGTAEIYSSLLGGYGGDFANAIAIDAKGDVFVAGSTGSKNFPVTSGAFQTASQGSSSAFVTKLDPTGSKALYSTYLGGAAGDSAQAIAVDAKGFAYVAGATNSSDFPLTSGTLEDASSGIDKFLKYIGPAGFATKLNQDGSGLEYSTYIEGYGTTVLGLAIDSAGSAYLAGGVAVTNTANLGAFRATPDALATPTSTGKSAFLIKLNPAAKVLNYATLIGGSRNDSAMAVALDGSGNAYATGSADSTNFPVTGNAFQSDNKAANSGGSNAFLGKFALAGEVHQTAYPAIRSALIPTVTYASCGIMVETCDDGGMGYYDICFDTQMTPVISNGPAPTGDLDMDWTGFYWELNSPPYSWSKCWNHIGTTSWPISCTSSATYSGDPAYAPSSGSGSDSEGGNCGQPSGNARPPRAATILRDPLQLHAMPPDRAAALLAKISPQPKPAAAEPKFTPPLKPRNNFGQTPEQILNLPEATTSCKSPLPLLTVTVLPAQNSRLYGAANPKFSYSVNGLLHGDEVSVTVEAPPTEKSPAGTYLVAATVSGAAAANYELVVRSAQITITPAPLAVTVLPQTASSVYGSPLPKFTYSLAGVRNQDQFTVAIQSGAPAGAWVGKYSVTAAVSGSAAGNYTITLHPATLSVTPAVLTVLPEDNYKLIPADYCYGGWKVVGLVNGDSPYVVGGGQKLWTDATSTSPPGAYTIFSSQEDLTAVNYAFKFGTGICNVFAPFNTGSTGVGSTASYQFQFKYGPDDPLSRLTLLSGGVEGAPFTNLLLSKDNGTYSGSFKFTPPQPGLWTATLQILVYPYSRAAITIPIHGIGKGAQSVFDPGPISLIQTAGISALQSPDAVAASENGILYIADAAPSRS